MPATPTRNADVIVVGLGAHGSATLRALAASGVRTLGIDRFEPPHDRGSSHGETRITRLSVGEGAAYVPLVKRSHEIWRELEAETGQTLLNACGGLVMAPSGGTERHHGHDDFLGNTIALAREHGIAHEVLTSEEIGRRFPQYGLRGDERGYYEPSAGFVYPERCIEAQLTLARAAGAEIRTGETVTGLDQSGEGVTVTTDRGVYAADRAVVTAGAWIPDLVGGAFGRHLKVHRQTLYWYETPEPERYAPGRFPVYIWMWGAKATEYFYGFPVAPGVTPAIKVATEQYAVPSEPDALERAVSPAEQAAMYERNIAGRLRGIGPGCIKAAACLYTTSPDSGFVVDRHPDHDRILVASACSGHGFKHSAALGEALARAITSYDGRGPDLASFTPERLAAAL